MHIIILPVIHIIVLTDLSCNLLLIFSFVFGGTGGWGAACTAGGLFLSGSPNSLPSLQVAPHPPAICPFRHRLRSIKLEVGLKGQTESYTRSTSVYFLSIYFCNKGINNNKYHMVTYTPSSDIYADVSIWLHTLGFESFTIRT